MNEVAETMNGYIVDKSPLAGLLQLCQRARNEKINRKMISRRQGLIDDTEFHSNR